MSQSQIFRILSVCAILTPCLFVLGEDDSDTTPFLVPPPPLEKIEISPKPKPKPKTETKIVVPQPSSAEQKSSETPQAPEPEPMKNSVPVPPVVLEKDAQETRKNELPKAVLPAQPPPLTPAQLGIVNALKKPLYIQLPEELTTWKGTTFPSSSMASPSAFGMDFGSMGFGLSYQGHTEISPDPDLDLSVGFGLGNAQKQLGMEVSATFVRLLHGVLDNGLLSIKIHHTFGDDFALGAGLENLFAWGVTDAAQSAYIVGSKYFRIRPNLDDYFSLLTISLGAGNGRFEVEKNYLAGANSINFFACVSLMIAGPLSIILDWHGSDLAAGISVAPFKQFHLVVSAGFDDLTHTSGTGPRYVAQAGLAFSFLQDTYL